MKIKLSRTSTYADRIRTYKVMIDNSIVATIGNSQTIDIDITPGVHEIYLKIDWCRSNKITIDAKKEVPIIYMKCGSSLGGWKVVLGLFYVLFYPVGYLFLESGETMNNHKDSGKIIDQGL